MQNSNDVQFDDKTKRKIDFQRIKTLDSFTREQCGRDNWTSGLRFCVASRKLTSPKLYRFQFLK